VPETKTELTGPALRQCWQTHTNGTSNHTLSVPGRSTTEEWTEN